MELGTKFSEKSNTRTPIHKQPGDQTKPFLLLETLHVNALVNVSPRFLPLTWRGQKYCIAWQCSSCNITILVLESKPTCSTQYIFCLLQLSTLYGHCPGCRIFQEWDVKVRDYSLLGQSKKFVHRGWGVRRGKKKQERRESRMIIGFIFRCQFPSPILNNNKKMLRILSSPALEIDRWFRTEMRSDTSRGFNNDHVSEYTFTTVEGHPGNMVLKRAVRHPKGLKSTWTVPNPHRLMLKIYIMLSQWQIQAWEAHADYIRFLEVHPTLPYVLSGSDDMSIKLWDWERQWDCTQVGSLFVSAGFVLLVLRVCVFLHLHGCFSG